MIRKKNDLLAHASFTGLRRGGGRKAGTSFSIKIRNFNLEKNVTSLKRVILGIH